MTLRTKGVDFTKAPPRPISMLGCSQVFTGVEFDYYRQPCKAPSRPTSQTK